MNKRKILIIKTGYSEFLDKEKDSRKVSLGDVLRTTPLLHLYKNDYVVWVSDKEVFPLLENNQYINRLLHFDWIVAEQLKSEEFDTIINLEKVPGICALSDKIRARRSRYGFTFNSQTGSAEAYDKAFEILAVGADPELKKRNKKNFQELLFEMLGEKWNGEEYILGYKSKSKELYDIGLNTQIGEKWSTKAWLMKNWDELEGMLVEDGFKVSRQDKQEKEILTNLYSYMDWLNSCKMIVSNDSLGMHLGIALKRKVLALVGPTPNKEVYFYERGKAILPEPLPNCLPCFKGTCERGKNCMEDISPKNVYGEIRNFSK